MLKFKQAFDAARKAGNRYFSWNGNDYNTMTKEKQNSGIPELEITLVNSKVMLEIILIFRKLPLIWVLK